MAALVDPVKVDIALKVLRDSLIDTLSDVIADPKSIVIGYEQGGTPRRARPYLNIQPLTLPGMRGTFTDEKETRLAKDSATATIVFAVSGRTYKVRVNGLPASYVAQGGDSITDIRDNLKIAVDALGLPVSTADNGIDAFDVTPDFSGALYSFTTPTDSTRLTVVVNESATTCVTYTVGQRYMTARLQAYAALGRAGSGGAHQIMNIAYATVDLPDVRLKLKDNRVSIKPIGIPQPLNMGEAGGARLESRAFLDLDIGLSSMSVRPANRIEVVEFQLSLDSNNVSFNLDINDPP